jgi:hypothetical protein
VPSKTTEQSVHEILHCAVLLKFNDFKKVVTAGMPFELTVMKLCILSIKYIYVLVCFHNMGHYFLNLMEMLY